MWGEEIDMNKAFMSDFYDRYYEDPVFETIGENEKFLDIRKRHSEAQEKLKAIIGDVGTPAWKAYEAATKVQYEYVDLVAKSMYLKGAEDRDKMLE